MKISHWQDASIRRTKPRDRAVIIAHGKSTITIGAEEMQRIEHEKGGPGKVRLKRVTVYPQASPGSDN
jgi:hypothetical protein